MSSNETPQTFYNLDPTDSWVLFSLGLPLFFIYAISLLLTSYNLHEAKSRFATKVLLRTQVMILLIEAFRLASAFCCMAQVWSDWYMLSPFYDISIVSGQFLSIVFAMAYCIHLSQVVLHIQRSDVEPEREMD